MGAQIPPTALLPPLARVSQYTPRQLTDVLNRLRNIYWPSPRITSSLPYRLGQPKSKVTHPIHDDSVPDSGYASAEEEDEEEERFTADDDDIDSLDIIRADAFEREFAIKWLTGFIARSDAWTSTSDEDEWYAVIDDITSLLAAFAGETMEEQAVTRQFNFPGQIRVELNDAPLSTKDHTSVGLQSWASSILLAERICLDPERFGLTLDRTLRVLELGAGTGLLSIVAAKLLSTGTRPEIIATDHHPDVLSNLTSNIQTNFPPPSSRILVLPLDWQYPTYTGPLSKPFDVILAADVVYYQEHARWIKTCVETLLSRPTPGSMERGGEFVLMIPLRSTGRHEGMGDTVDAIFPDASQARREGIEPGWKLAVLEREEMDRQEGVGRADEGGYKLYKIGWVR